MELKLDNVLSFIFAGLATLTLKSQKTGVHYTYKIIKAQNDPGDTRPGVFFVHLLTSEDDYNYIGIIPQDKPRKSLITTKKSALTRNSSPVKAFNFMLAQVQAGKQHQDLVIYHAGKCGRCGRELTTPESIELGFGPVCAEKVFG